MPGFDSIKIKTARRQGNQVSLTIGSETLGGSILALGEFIRRLRHMHRKTMGAAPPAEFSEHALFTEGQRQFLREVAKYRPPDLTKFRLTLSVRHGKEPKDREYKTFAAAERTLKAAIKKDLAKQAIWKARILPPGAETYLQAVASYSLHGKGENAVWYKDTPGGHMVLFKVYS